jgi:hypothetical protein
MKKTSTSPPKGRPVVRTVPVVIVGVALSVAAITSTAAAAPKTLRTLTIKATEFSYSTPRTASAGWTRITIRNRGGEQHEAQVVRLNPGVTFVQLQVAAAGGKPNSLLALVTPVGGPNAVAPGRSATTVDDLVPGHYALICFLYSPDGTEHVAKGMVAPLTVTPTRSPSTAPNVTSTVVLRDFSFGIPAKLAGHSTIAVRNDGTQSHEMALFQLQPGKTIEDAKRFLFTPPGTAPPIPAPGQSVGGIAGLAPGATGYVELALKAGQYVAVCFLPDPTKNGLPHFIEGMIQQFAIK